MTGSAEIAAAPEARIQLAHGGGGTLMQQLIDQELRDIGSLAVIGTANDLAMAGARPLHLGVGLILEEGLPLAL